MLRETMKDNKQNSLNLTLKICLDIVLKHYLFLKGAISLLFIPCLRVTCQRIVFG